MKVAQSRDETRLEVGIIGGGRWARTIAKVLLAVETKDIHLGVCSPHYPNGWRKFASDLSEAQSQKFRIFNDTKQLISQKDSSHIFVVRSAKDNASSAVEVLEHSKNCFVEKPFALTLEEAERVVSAAHTARCSVGLVFLFANNLQLFCAEVRDKIPRLEKIEIMWRDLAAEIRYGENKKYDPGISVMQDVFPHIWSLISMLVDPFALVVERCNTDNGGQTVTLQLSANFCNIAINMVRDSDVRQRVLVCTNKEGQRAEIDFSVEPGSAIVNGDSLDVQNGFISPLKLQLEYFLGLSSGPPLAKLTRVEYAIESIKLITPWLDRIRVQQIQVVRKGMDANASKSDVENALFALRELSHTVQKSSWLPLGETSFFSSEELIELQEWAEKSYSQGKFTIPTHVRRSINSFIEKCLPQFM